jgi:hypothetical protein
MLKRPKDEVCDEISDIKNQKQIAVLFAKLIEIKQEINKEREPANLDPCISYSINLCNGDWRCKIYTSIDCMSIGK